MEFPAGLVEGRFKTRLNRFLAIVEVQGREVGVHVANSGRMREILVPGYRVLISPKPGGHRKTGYDLALVDLGTALASADARLPNALVAEAFSQGRLPQFRDYSEMQAEVVFGESRLDLRLQGPSGLCYVEAKSVTLVVDGVGLFPDAPTTRGAKHVRSLAQAVKEGHRPPWCSSSSGTTPMPSDPTTKLTRTSARPSGNLWLPAWKPWPMAAG